MYTLFDILANESSLTLVSGEKGLHAPVNRTHMVENLEIARSFISKDELIFTTGSGLGSSSELTELLRAAFEKGACGIVVNLGPYIDKVSAKAAAFSAENSFPLFTCPWDVRMAEIMHRTGCMIEGSDHREQRSVSAFRNALLRRTDGHSLRNLGYSEKTGFRVAVLGSGAAVRGVPLFEAAGLSVAVFADADRNSIEKMISGPAAVSSPCDMFSLRSAFTGVRKLFLLNQDGSGICFMEDSGLCQLLLAIEDRRVLENYCDSVLGKLLRADGKKGGELLNVLHTYIRCGSALKEASELLGLHKNTITNKVHRCEEILGIDVSDPSVRMDIEAAILARRILSLED